MDEAPIELSVAAIATLVVSVLWSAKNWFTASKNAAVTQQNQRTMEIIVACQFEIERLKIEMRLLSDWKDGYKQSGQLDTAEKVDSFVAKIDEALKRHDDAIQKLEHKGEGSGFKL